MYSVASGATAMVKALRGKVLDARQLSPFAYLSLRICSTDATQGIKQINTLFTLFLAAAINHPLLLLHPH
ncbi:hypothetical protein COEREDRAFT_90488 [Coemansia reversa NRRL 1564]|uniref:Uncharacterized protein n=1 Tax=Coemansia reversa (strain ATCC 12441 / NRRL 1564) TaxID=763665 RepID=A0A2G5BJF3_COERN|nr:hypothetical protein COEREDRAFT_90488 [Coemansia reversa NRRL 1564]|eukprot:PIA19133.1 hypothetical protein COEREDRAFT_90488 [Coemansia reversa NRRL 1564]